VNRNDTIEFKQQFLDKLVNFTILVSCKVYINLHIKKFRFLSLLWDHSQQGKGKDGDTTGGSRKKLEELNWDNSFTRELPGDTRTGGPVRQVNICSLLFDGELRRLSFCHLQLVLP
jgi:hypothetical protein